MTSRMAEMQARRRSENEQREARLKEVRKIIRNTPLDEVAEDVLETVTAMVAENLAEPEGSWRRNIWQGQHQIAARILDVQRRDWQFDNGEVPGPSRASYYAATVEEEKAVESASRKVRRALDFLTNRGRLRQQYDRTNAPVWSTVEAAHAQDEQRRAAQERARALRERKQDLMDRVARLGYTPLELDTAPAAFSLSLDDFEKLCNRLEGQ